MGRPSHTQEHYGGRLDWALSHIDANLAAPLRLAKLAECAAFSPWHFHRIFADRFGETPQSYIRRCRLERGAAMLRYGKHCAVAHVAERSGFTSVEAFDRAFRSHFGMTPTRWRAGGHLGWAAESGGDVLANYPGEVQLRALPAVTVAYLRKIGVYGQDETELWARLLSQMDGQGARPLLCFGIGLDDPSVTPPDRCRYDACVALAPGQRAPTQLPSKTLAGGLHAVLRYHGPAGRSERHWRWFLGEWLVNSPYSVGNHPCFERFVRGAPGDGMVESELCLPVSW